ncbi:hypothetical protein Q644_07010 [Brucella intermedia 229E]|uniref:Uncharacterized protein n=3 Tax=Brucella intermedia TaxID=94625 RepID=U4V5Y4_9HYPH|nr:hypothetical protein Q644_07010 [Brucella intermedia 229E]
MSGWSEIELGDARQKLSSWKGSKFNLLVTSPPYCGVTNYRLDNWIRLWLLGDLPLPDNKSSEKYADRESYRSMLMDVFSSAKMSMTESATVLVRTDSRLFTRDVTAATLRALWPDHRMLAKSERPEKTQTQLFGDRTEKPGETDMLLLPPGDRRRPSGYGLVRDHEMASVPAAFSTSGERSDQALAVRA